MIESLAWGFLQFIGVAVALFAFLILIAWYMDWSMKRHIRRQMERRRGYWYERSRR
jgi:hypothetical protein